MVQASIVLLASALAFHAVSAAPFAVTHEGRVATPEEEEPAPKPAPPVAAPKPAPSPNPFFTSVTNGAGGAIGTNLVNEVEAEGKKLFHKVFHKRNENKLVQDLLVLLGRSDVAEAADFHKRNENKLVQDLLVLLGRSDVAEAADFHKRNENKLVQDLLVLFGRSDIAAEGEAAESILTHLKPLGEAIRNGAGATLGATAVNGAVSEFDKLFHKNSQRDNMVALESRGPTHSTTPAPSTPKAPNPFVVSVGNGAGSAIGTNLVNEVEAEGKKLFHKVFHKRSSLGDFFKAILEGRSIDELD